MKKRELIQAVAIHTDVDNKTAAKLVEGTIDVILATVAKGDVVMIPGHLPHWWSALDSDVSYLRLTPDPDSQQKLR